MLEYSRLGMYLAVDAISQDNKDQKKARAENEMAGPQAALSLEGKTTRDSYFNFIFVLGVMTNKILHLL